MCNPVFSTDEIHINTLHIIIWSLDSFKFDSCLFVLKSKQISSTYLVYLETKIYETVILLLVLYGCERWFVILREKHRAEGIFIMKGKNLGIHYRGMEKAVC
jgi:hypothetical protein